MSSCNTQYIIPSECMISNMTQLGVNESAVQICNIKDTKLTRLPIGQCFEDIVENYARLLGEQLSKTVTNIPVL